MDAQKKKILLLGGEGFIGRNLAAGLSLYQCFSLGQAPSVFSERQDTFLRGNPYQEKFPNEYDVVIHLIDNKNCAPGSYLEEEQKLAENISLQSKNHLIVFSSAVVYADPESEYGKRKQILEDFYTAFCREKNIKLTLVRLFNTFGPYQIPYRQGSLIANLIYNHQRGTVTEINWMEARRDFIYAPDIARCIEYYIENELTGIFDLGSGELVSIRDVIALLEETVFQEPVNIKDKMIREGIVPRKAENKILQHVQLTSLTEGLRETSVFYQKNKKVIQDVC